MIIQYTSFKTVTESVLEQLTISLTFFPSRRRFLKMRAAAILIQKNWRAHAGRRNYLRMRTGYMRMQALIRSRILSHKFRHLRGHIVRLQARCRGYLIRRSVFLTKQNDVMESFVERATER